jgi:hypothetical protein
MWRGYQRRLDRRSGRCGVKLPSVSGSSKPRRMMRLDMFAICSGLGVGARGDAGSISSANDAAAFLCARVPRISPTAPKWLPFEPNENGFRHPMGWALSDRESRELKR